MIRKVGGKTLKAMREEIGGVWELGRGKRQSGILARPGLLVFAVVSAGLAVTAVVLYLRKRRQVADHYTMGADKPIWEEAPRPERVPEETAHT